MQNYEVEVQRTYYTTVTVPGEDPEDAVRWLNDSEFELPPVEQWQALKGYLYIVRDADGNELYERDGSTRLAVKECYEGDGTGPA